MNDAKLQKTVCPHCHREIEITDRTIFPEPVTMERYLARLKARRSDLASIQDWLTQSRSEISIQDDRGTFHLLVAVEQLFNYLYTDLNHTLKKEGLNPIERKKR